MVHKNYFQISLIFLNYSMLTGCQNYFQISLIFLKCSMLTGCQKLDSLLTRFDMHEFIKKKNLIGHF